ncbi:helix-turn-helix transcriptional regulator [Skermania sp. ID1734]|uniref:winged helix-turn-helix transcriptional regulator n=1 Tax=Skermania sp. ID1734 TaxID=2597516 RepID=UPI00117FE837|nr:helix-turn-helix domain-containing protein [Skermania sp. ID1734]TSD98065.1 helix-turn-helix transcriptional regulator [Skermania sp. ID1734]
MGRNYRQYCGLARALEVVGDRWNLLIVRELLIAPARYRQLIEGLPGVATNLLTDRLRDLEAAGVVERRLAEDGATVVYALTPWGAALREPIEGLIRWSAPLMVRGPEGDHFHDEWLLIALPALFAGRISPESSAAIGLSVNGQLIQVQATPAGIEVSPHEGRELDAIVRAEPPIILGLAAGMLTLDNVHELVDIDGDEAAVRTVLSAQRS